MSELPPPDLLDTRGRMRRLALAFVFGVLAGAIAFAICDHLAKPDAMAGGFDGGHRARAYKFVYYTTGFAFAAVFSLALWIQNRIADAQYRKSLTAKATLRK